MWECPSFQRHLLYELGGGPDIISFSCSDSCRQFCCFWVLWHSPDIILSWNEIVKKVTRIPLAVPCKSRSECPPKWLSSQLRTEEFLQQGYLQKGKHTERFCCCVYLPAHGQRGEGFAWDKQPRQVLALGTRPLASGLNLQATKLDAIQLCIAPLHFGAEGT